MINPSVQGKYSLTNHEYLVFKSIDFCEICGSEENLCIDHDHSCCPEKYTCGACTVGVLCNRCNLALGHLQDSVELLENAIEYVRKTRI